MTADLTFADLVPWLRENEVDRVADALIAAGEPARRALAVPLLDYLHGREQVPYPLPDYPMDDPRWTGGRPMRREIELALRNNDALRVAGIACLASVTKVVAWIRDGWFRRPGPALADTVVRVLHAPGRPSPAAIAVALAGALRSRGIEQQWWLAGRLLAATGTPAPPTEPVLRGWLQQTGYDAARLRADPHTPALLPHLFTVARLSAEWGSAGPAAFAALAEGADRGVLLAGCLDRLAEGDRPAAIRPVVELHQRLAPTPDEYADHRQTYLVMLDSPHSTVVGLALSALRAVDDAGLLDAEEVAGAALSVLPRREKKLVRAQLAWLDAALSRKPDPVLFEALLAGLANEAVDLAESTLRVITKHVAAAGAAGRGQWERAAEGLSGDLRRQADALSPAVPSAPGLPGSSGLLAAGPGSPGFPVAALMPIRSIPELAAAAAELLDQFGPEPVLLEQVLEGLVRFAHLDRDGLAAALAPKIPETWTTPPAELLRAVVYRRPPDHRPPYEDQAAAPPYWLLFARYTELGRQMVRKPPIALLATPATVDGHVDPERVLTLLTAAEESGWQPGPADLTQALLRLPRTVDPAVTTTASRLRNPAARTVTAWLRAGGLPDPTVITLPAIRHTCTGAPACACPEPPRTLRTTAFEPITVAAGAIPLTAPKPLPNGLPRPRRSSHEFHFAEPVGFMAPEPVGFSAPAPVRVVAPEPVGFSTPAAVGVVAPDNAAMPGGSARADDLAGLVAPEGLLAMPVAGAAARAGDRRRTTPMGYWPMMLPGHPEIVAAHAVPELARSIHGDHRNQLDILLALAASTGPFGPATALCLAYGFTAGRAASRVITTDAFVELAARGRLDGMLVGRELAHLQRSGLLTVKRVAVCLTEALRAGAGDAVWATVREVLPAALAAPGPGTPDLLVVAEAAAAATRATDDLPEVTAAASQRGRTRLISEASRLARTLSGNLPASP
ncbi:DUF6493 family protein [Actinoplanes palleronii]|uniref:Secreted protein n=1 Tax=Actinoplanes palleronii TaxID=113570 RepID=A0ABQ4BCN9_9ACTN|nr:DUF6493 family protein [Actinoplanes palleronii]GIE68436.1 hypothetical protein Apa02nite_045440 [Actinoplanes palleronii]